MTTDDGRIRIDKWLWAARFFKTRSLASDAVEGGKVQINGERVKPAKAVKVDDRVDIRIGAFSWQVTVLALSDRRGPAPEAQRLYVESEASRAGREETAARIRASRPTNPLQKGRPTKKARRELDRIQDDGEA